MYTEEKKHFPILKVLIRILLVIAVIIILLLLFPIQKLDTFYDKVFNDNLYAMKDAAMSYFTTDRLPENSDTPVKITLQEMLDKKLLLEFTDKNNKKCNTEKSYVEVSKGTKEYEMKIFLSCDNDEDYIIVPMGCYDTCFDCTENKDTTTCQFKQTTTKKVVIGYECANKGYTLSGNKCYYDVKETIEKEAQSKVTNTCESGYTYNDATGKCIKTITETEKATVINECPTGYTFDGSTCTKTTTATVIKNTTCPSGYTLSGTTCTKTETTAATTNTTCPSGYTLSGTTCTKTLTTTATTSYSCSTAGYIYNATLGKCSKTNTAEVTKTVSYTCSSYYDNAGTYKAATTCYKTTEGTETTTTYYPSRATDLIETYVVKECDTCSTVRYYVYKTQTVSSAAATKNTTNTCPSGYTYNSTNDDCEYVETETAKVTRTCATGYTLSDSNCIKVTTTTATTSTTCPTGYTLNGNTCTKATTTTATTSTTCPTGYTLSSGNCIKVETATVTVKKTCNADAIYDSVQGLCVKTTTSYGKLTSTKTYYCTQGTLTNNTCKISTVVSKYVLANKLYETKTYTIYKWSSKTSLNGWTATGKCK